MASTMVAAPDARPDVLPTERLLPNGIARPDCARPSAASTTCATPGRSRASWLVVIALVGACVWWNNPFGTWRRSS